MTTLETRRIDNYSGAAACPHCANSGIVCSAKRQQFKTTPDLVEEMAPCPKCEKGGRMEFGLYKDKEGNEEQHKGGGPWGEQGYWRGKMHTFWAELPHGIEDGPREPIPEWVKVWRFARDHGVTSTFPQQAGCDVPDDEPVLSMDEYEKMAEAWRRAGAPSNGDSLHLGGEVLSSL